MRGSLMSDKILTDHPEAKTFWMHTSKGLKRHPDLKDRVYAVVGELKFHSITDDGEWLVAWKMERNLNNGTLWHPAYGHIKFEDLPKYDLFILAGENGSVPTAAFVGDDSLYKKVKTFS